jgi:NTE family protein
VIAANERKAMRDADLLITVPLEKFTSIDYRKADAIIKLGYEAAAANADQLSALSVDEATWNRYLAEREGRRKSATTPQFVEVSGVPPEIAHLSPVRSQGLPGILSKRRSWTMKLWNWPARDRSRL